MSSFDDNNTVANNKVNRIIGDYNDDDIEYEEENEPVTIDSKYLKKINNINEAIVGNLYLIEDRHLINNYGRYDYIGYYINETQFILLWYRHYDDNNNYEWENPYTDMNVKTNTKSMSYILAMRFNNVVDFDDDYFGKYIIINITNTNMNSGKASVYELDKYQFKSIIKSIFIRNNNDKININNIKNFVIDLNYLGREGIPKELYSPEYNPDKIFNNIFKKNSTGGKTKKRYNISKKKTYRHKKSKKIRKIKNKKYSRRARRVK
jgi:hypothetical protein